MSDDARHGKWWAWIAVAAIVLLTSIRVAVTWRVFSQTVDEPTHVAAGFRFLTAGVYDLDVEHPPLTRVLFALGPVWSGAKVNPAVDRVEQGREIFTRNGRYRDNLAQSRAGNLPFLIAAVIAVAAWAKRLSGWSAAILAAALLSSLPPVLGHAGLATTDAAVAATTTIALLAFWIWLENPTWRRALLLGIAIGFGLISKFSFLVFFGTGAIVAFVIRVLTRDRYGPMRVRRTVAQVPVLAAIAILMIWSAYRFSAATVNEVNLKLFPHDDAWNVAARYAATPGYDWVRPDIIERYWKYGRELKAHGIHDVDFVDWAKAAGYPSPLAGRSGDTMSGAPPVRPLSTEARVLEPLRRAGGWICAHVPLPAPEFVTGVMYVKRHSEIGHRSFFLGDYRERGWWYYFPVIFLFKTPLAFTILAIAGIVLLLPRAVRLRNPAAPTVAVAPLAMFIPAMTSGINIGIRHILPVYPLFTVAAACGVVELWRRAAAGSGAARVLVARSALVTLLAWFFIATTAAHPDYLAYFNELAGHRPDRIAVDSNLDWGQDLLRLADETRRRHIKELNLAYFGNAIWRTPIVRNLEPGVCTTGWVAISETLMKQGGPEHRGLGYRWLENRPWEEVGRSIRLYQIPESACKGAPVRRAQ